MPSPLRTSARASANKKTGAFLNAFALHRGCAPTFRYFASHDPLNPACPLLHMLYNAMHDRFSDVSRRVRRCGARDAYAPLQKPTWPLRDPHLFAPLDRLPGKRCHRAQKSER